MTYAIKQNLIDRYGSEELLQLTDRANTGLIDDTVIARALADADAEINGYLATHYTLPLAPVPAALEKLACDIARYRLYEDRVTEIVEKRYDDAIKFLQGVASGKVSLGIDAANAQPVATGGPSFSAGDRVFTKRRANGTTGTLDDY